jgi:membrane protein DedA with SNARE-associated domain
MARRVKRRGILSGGMIWYVIYGIAGYFAYNYWRQMNQIQPQIQSTNVPPAALLP